MQNRFRRVHQAVFSSGSCKSEKKKTKQEKEQQFTRTAIFLTVLLHIRVSDIAVGFVLLALRFENQISFGRAQVVSYRRSVSFENEKHTSKQKKRTWERPGEKRKKYRLPQLITPWGHRVKTQHLGTVNRAWTFVSCRWKKNILTSCCLQVGLPKLRSTKCPAFSLTNSTVKLQG